MKLQRNKVSEIIIAQNTESILHGIEFLHMNKIVHGSMKSANIFVTRNGMCKIADFGQVKQICSMSTSKRSNLHDIYWTAPELICKKKRDASTHNRFSDIWSLGCVVYELATGKPPWSEEDEFTLIMKLANSKQGPPYPSMFSNELKDFLDCCF